MISVPEIVFVYGTLRRGGSNHFRMATAEFISAGTVSGRLYRVHWYPGMVLDDEAGEEIHGDVYAVDSETLATLDVFEGVAAGETQGSEYRRLKSTVVLRNSQTITAWMWEWIGMTDESQRVSDGDWLKTE